MTAGHVKTSTQVGRPVAAAELTWETLDGETFGYYDLGENGDIEIAITGRIRPSMWTTGTNVRDWTVYDENNEVIADGQADGLRNAKRAALQALNDYFAESVRVLG